MPCAHRIPLTACRWPHHARRPAARSGGPTVAHTMSPALLQHGENDAAPAATCPAVGCQTCQASSPPCHCSPERQPSAVPRPKGVMTLGSDVSQSPSMASMWPVPACPPPTILSPNKTVPAGPAGCGKSTVLKVLADSLGIELCTWEAPTPVLWQEHLHQVCCLHIRQRWPVLREQCAPRQISEHDVTRASG